MKRKTLAEKCWFLDLSPAEVSSALEAKKNYRIKLKPKKNGGWRVLYIPPAVLLKVQKRTKHFLENRYGLTEYKWNGKQMGRGFIKGVCGFAKQGCSHHLKKHVSSDWFLSFDIVDAFYSVDIQFVRDILVAGDLCPETVDLILDLTTYKGLFPQGAPTSPFLFWLSLTRHPEGRAKSLWSTLKAILPYEWEITCYIDGFLISGLKPIPPPIKAQLLETVEEFGFKTHKIFHRNVKHGMPPICGLSISRKEWQWPQDVILPRKTIRKWRGIIGRARFDDSLLPRVKGFISFLRSVYGWNLPPQIAKPYQQISHKLK
jgi:hypothetical protein